MTNTQKFARAFGAIYVLVGIIGFISALGGTTSQEGNELLGIFGVTLIHNVIHLAVGIAFLAAAGTDAGARTVSTAIGVVYLLVAILGFLNVEFVVDVLHNNMADNLLHLVTAVLALYFGLAGKTTTAAA